MAWMACKQNFKNNFDEGEVSVKCVFDEKGRFKVKFVSENLFLFILLPSKCCKDLLDLFDFKNST